MPLPLSAAPLRPPLSPRLETLGLASALACLSPVLPPVPSGCRDSPGQKISPGQDLRPIAIRCLHTSALARLLGVGSVPVEIHSCALRTSCPSISAVLVVAPAGSADLTRKESRAFSFLLRVSVSRLVSPPAVRNRPAVAYGLFLRGAATDTSLVPQRSSRQLPGLLCCF